MVFVYKFVFVFPLVRRCYLFVLFFDWTKYGEDDGKEDEAMEEAKEADHEEDLEEGHKDVRLGSDEQ